MGEFDRVIHDSMGIPGGWIVVGRDVAIGDGNGMHAGPSARFLSLIHI